MPSTFTTSLRFELQASGENLNAWGAKLNAAVTRVDKAIAGRSAITLAGATYTLSTSNLLDDEARAAILDFTGVGGCNVVIPSVTKTYMVRNLSSGVVTLTTGAGATVALAVGDACMVFCDGSGVYREMIAGVSYKTYVDAQAWAVVSGVLPGQAGQAGKFLKTDGTTPSWSAPDPIATSNLTDIAAYTAARDAKALVFALIF